MIRDINMSPNNDGSATVEYSGFVNGCEGPGYRLKFHFFNAQQATEFADAFDAVKGVEVIEEKI